MDGSGNTIFNLFVIAFLLFSNGFFVASEFAMVKVRKTRIEQLVNEGNYNASIALEALKDLDKFIAAVQLGVTISSIGLGWVGEGTLAHIIEPIFAGYQPEHCDSHNVCINSICIDYIFPRCIRRTNSKINCTGIHRKNSSMGCSSNASFNFYI